MQMSRNAASRLFGVADVLKHAADVHPTFEKKGPTYDGDGELTCAEEGNDPTLRTVLLASSAAQCDDRLTDSFNSSASMSVVPCRGDCPVSASGTEEEDSAAAASDTSTTSANVMESPANTSLYSSMKNGDADIICNSSSVASGNQKTTGRPQVKLLMHRLQPESTSFLMHAPPPRSLNASDVQSFLLYASFGPVAAFKPLWCSIQRWKKIMQVVLVIVQGATDETFQRHKGMCFKFLSKKMQNQITFVPSPTFVEDFFSVPLTGSQVVKQAEALQPSLSTPVDGEKGAAPGPIPGRISPNSKPVNGVPCVPPCKPPIPPPVPVAGRKPASKPQMLMRMVDMVTYGYDLPVGHNTDFDFTREVYHAVSLDSPIYAIDCEMCFTDEGHELTRVSIVDEQLNVVLDRLVKPYNPIRDYLTQFSGITAKILAPVSTRLEEVRTLIKECLPPDAILVGHTLNFDLRALKLFHPFVIDIGILFNLSGSPQLRSSLSTLTEIFLHETIQNNHAGHCSVEDAIVTMRLMKLKLENGLDFGNVSFGFDLQNFLKTNPGRPPNPPPTKRSRTDSSVASPKIDSKCSECLQPVSRACQFSYCLCQSSTSSFCLSCRKSRIRTDSPNSKQPISCRKIFDIPIGGEFENAFTFFKRNKKSLFWVSGPLHSSKLDAICKKTPKSRHVHEPSVEKRVEAARGQLLQHDFVILELDLNDADSCGECMKLDRSIEEVYQTTVRHSLLCVLMQDSAKPDAKGEMLFLVKS